MDLSPHQIDPKITLILLLRPSEIEEGDFDHWNWKIMFDLWGVILYMCEMCLHFDILDKNA